jgi:lysozyme family protein
MSLETALNKTLQNEGGWNPADGGTYRGITKNNWASWRGWDIIRKYMPLRPLQVINDPELDKAVEEFYINTQWRPFHFDKIQNENIAMNIFDWLTTTNPSLMFKALHTYFGLTPKGKMSPELLTALNNASNNDIVDSRKKYYIAISSKTKKLKPFLNAWIKRTEKFA